MKIVKRTSALLAALLVTAACQSLPAVMAAEPAPGVMILKVDREDKFQLPRNFRKASDDFVRKAPAGQQPSRLGLDGLNISGSSYYSQLELAKMLMVLPAQRLTILDLRLEPHGHLNGMGVSWYSAYKRANWGKSSAELNTIEKGLVQGTLKAPVSVARLAEDKGIADEKTVAVAQAMTEAEVAAMAGVNYFRIHVADYARPTDQNVDDFLKFYKGLSKDAWIHVHCEAGEGRTTVFMSMIDMLHNADKVSYDDIMARHWLLGGLDIRNSASSDPVKKTGYAQRAEFTRQFYDYAKNRPNKDMTWSEWAKRYK